MNYSQKQFWFVVVVYAVLFFSNVLYSQSDKSLYSMFEDFIGKTWIGHYKDEETSHYKHELRWDYILNSSAIKEIKKVDELSFEMESMIYTNRAKNELAFLTLDSKKGMSEGIIYEENNKLVYEGTSYYSSGKTNFKKIFEILPDGKLSDTFLRETNGEWVQGHLIIYRENNKMIPYEKEGKPKME